MLRISVNLLKNANKTFQVEDIKKLEQSKEVKMNGKIL